MKPSSLYANKIRFERILHHYPVPLP
jgi:hypothetical protein